MRVVLISVLSLVFYSVFFIHNVQATDFSSTNFTVRDSVLSGGGGYSTSSNFQLFSAFSQLSTGTSTSDAFELRSGFLYFPESESSSSPPPPSTTPPSSGGTGSGSVTTPIRPPPPPVVPPVIPPLVLPLIPPFISFITGELIPTLGCGRSDLNCDGRIDLRDLSILLTRPGSVTGKILSLLFSDWTRALPAYVIAQRDQAAKAELNASLQPRPGLAEISEALKAPAGTIESKETVSKPSLIKRIWNGVYTVAKTIVKSVVTAVKSVLGLFGL